MLFYLYFIHWEICPYFHENRKSLMSEHFYSPSLQLSTFSHHLPFRQIHGKPCFRLNIEWCILSYCPLKCLFLCHNSFSSSHHHLTPFPLWDTWSPEYEWVAEKWVTLTYSTDIWMKNFRTKLLILLIFNFFFSLSKFKWNTPSVFGT